MYINNIIYVVKKLTSEFQKTKNMDPWLTLFGPKPVKVELTKQWLLLPALPKLLTALFQECFSPFLIGHSRSQKRKWIPEDKKWVQEANGKCKKQWPSEITCKQVKAQKYDGPSWWFSQPFWPTTRKGQS